MLHRSLAFGLAAVLLVASVAARAGLVEAAAAVKPSVVAVGTYKETQNPRFGFRGSGFAVGDGRLIVTNAHVLPPPESTPDAPDAQLAIQIPLGHGRLEVRTATLLALDKDHDMALLRVGGSPLPALQFADPASVRDGMAIGFIGFPIGGVLGYTPVTHHGIISAITAVAEPAAAAGQLDNKTIMRLRRGSFDIYQLDATAYPGNSGGPVFDAASGKVVGVINMVLVKGTKESALSHPTGISYAVPAEYARRLIEAR